MEPARTAPQDAHPGSPSPWQRIADGDDFRALLRARTRFIVAATLFFLVYYFALPILTGFWPQLMARKVMGPFSLAYLFALTQFPMTWLLAAAYLRAAAKFDRDAATILARHVPGPSPAKALTTDDARTEAHGK
jgi:uncharacterized membrane protein (DUF485 family)